MDHINVLKGKGHWLWSRVILNMLSDQDDGDQTQMIDFIHNIHLLAQRLNEAHRGLGT